jgi:hypothetical protein
MARQKAHLIQGATPGDTYNQLINWLATANPEPVVNEMGLDLDNNRILLIYKEKIEEV